MTDNNDTNGGPRGADNASGRDHSPKRVIGTPPPGESPGLLSPAEGPEDAGHELDEKTARRAERVVALFFTLTFLAGIAFIVFYAVWPGTVGNIERAQRSNYALGAAMTVAFLGLAIGVTIWVRSLMTTKEAVQDRGSLSSSPEDRAAFTEHFLRGAEESGITKRPLLRRTLLAAAAPLGLAPLLLLRDLGPLPEKKLRHTVWKAGTRLVVDGTDQPIRATDFDTPGGIITVVPEGNSDNLDALATSTVVLINVPPDKLKVTAGRENWHVGGIIAYSKICTHVGCPAALYERTTHHILCPCHQSTFDATDAAKVIFGPAARPLPQLPIGVDSEGYLIATSDFHEPVGPSFWERGRPKV